MSMRPVGMSVVCAAVVAALAAGCTSDRLYAAGQQWQRNECNRLPERDAQQRCLERASVARDDYERRPSADPKAPRY
ncbi:MAG TPA: hypothetical protein PKA20_03305 [Burkholderiaceae bacterium]|nr:hypothetical protein [Burkholderiaceae bacterium]